KKRPVPYGTGLIGHKLGDSLLSWSIRRTFPVRLTILSLGKGISETSFRFSNGANVLFQCFALQITQVSFARQGELALVRIGCQHYIIDVIALFEEVAWL